MCGENRKKRNKKKSQDKFDQIKKKNKVKVKYNAISPKKHTNDNNTVFDNENSQMLDLVFLSSLIKPIFFLQNSSIVFEIS